jgi:SWIM zinc finger
MDSSMIGKIEKAKRYAAEADRRVAFTQFRVTLQGDNNTWEVAFDNGRWSCGCHYFSTHGLCQHTMTMERVLGSMLPPSPEAAMAVAAQAVTN